MAIICDPTRLSMLSIFILFFCTTPPLALSLVFEKLQLPPGVSGPESYAFKGIRQAKFGLLGVLYTGVYDGQILTSQGGTANFTDFAFTAPNIFATQVWEAIRGLEFSISTNQLYVADAYFGLSVAGPKERLTTQLANSVNGVPFRFLDGLGLHSITGDVYFTQFSATYQLRNASVAVTNNDKTGSLLKYDIRTKQVTELVTGLSGAAGTAVSALGDFVLVSEYIGKRTQRLWLTGAKRNTTETFMSFQGNPDNIKRASNGDFWVAVNAIKTSTQDTVPIREGVKWKCNVIKEVCSFEGTSDSASRSLLGHS
nr:protein strictosidine synthase-like 12 [Quercus suber]